jgi:cell division protein FtsL
MKTMFISLATFADSFSIIEVAAIAIAAAALSFLAKNKLLKKYKHRILQLEDEMLTNHATILSLEKRNTELQKQIKEIGNNDVKKCAS